MERKGTRQTPWSPARQGLSSYTVVVKSVKREDT